MLMRQSILLALLQKVAPADKIQLVKWLFLLRKETPLKHLPGFYDFFPYKYGPFSFLLYRDLGILERRGYLQVVNSLVLSKVRLSLKLPEIVSEAIDKILRLYGGLKKEELLQHVYRSYPWYTSWPIRRLSFHRPEILTVGYEGESIDSFLNLLLGHSIDIVIDVRNNPASRKYGFSGKTLSHICKHVQIDYLSLPALGVPSLYRSLIASGGQGLWEIYAQKILPKTKSYREKVAKILGKRKGVLLCYEQDPLCCHRSILAKALREETGWKVRDLKKGAFL